MTFALAPLAGFVPADRLALGIIPVQEITHGGLGEDGHGYDAYGGGDVLGERAVASLHGVHLNTGNTTSAPGVATPVGPERDAPDGVLSNEHVMPFVDCVVAPDPDRVVRLQGCRLIDRSPPPVTAACHQ
jgi:hypothetical protein